MDFSSINGLSSTYSTAQSAAHAGAANSIKNAADRLSSNSSEEELKGVLRDFESYFVEQTIKQMKKTFTDEDESNSTMSQYKDLYMDAAIEKVADTLVDQIGENYTQQLYEQMKRNYNIK